VLLAQCASDVQSVRQLLFVLQTYTSQLCAVVWLQVPAPEQNDAGWNVDPLHDAARPHEAEAAASWQPPVPSQAPVLPQGGAAGHWPAGAAAPAEMLAHIPRLPARLHA
jgi:hypothetical protein